MNQKFVQGIGSSSYSKAGVNTQKAAEFVSQIKNKVSANSVENNSRKINIGAFAGLYDFKQKGFIDPLLVTSCDGVGTKLLLAIQENDHKGIGIDLVAMCVNDLVAMGAHPLMFLDYMAFGKLDINVGSSLVDGILEGCALSGCELVGGETAELPGLYSGKHYDIAGTTIGMVERNKVISGQSIEPGDILLGLRSSGFHANGFSLVRKVIDDKGIDIKQPASFDSSRSLGSYLLEPTRIYVKPLLNVINKFSVNITGIVHITGGGIYENLPRVLSSNLCAVVDVENYFECSLTSWFAEQGALSNWDLLNTFNCGIGMILVCKKNVSSNIISLLSDQGIEACSIGCIAEKDEASDATIKLDVNKLWK